MQDFPANSQKARARPEEQREQPKRIERVTSGEAVRRKKGLGRQFKDTFIGGSARMAFEYVTMEVIVPSVKDLLAEAVHSGVDKWIHGESRPRRRATPPTYSNVGHVNYNSPRMQDAKPPSPRPLSRQSRTRQEFDEIVIQSRQDAEEVIDRLFDILSHDGLVTVADLYDLTGIQSSHTDHKWGWTNMRGAKATRIRSGGFLLDLPQPEPLN